MNRKALPAPPRQAASAPRSRPRISERLARQIDDAVAAGPRDAKGRLVRSDGWTPARMRIFLEVLAGCGIARDAARAAGMSRSSAYALRMRTEGGDFAKCWRGAVLASRPALEDELMSRAMHGCVEIIVRDGEVWGEKHSFDNRHSRAMLTRLDKMAIAEDRESVTARHIAGALDEFIDIVCAGGEGADEFLRARAEAEADAQPDQGPRRLEVRFVRPEPE